MTEQRGNSRPTSAVPQAVAKPLEKATEAPLNCQARQGAGVLFWSKVIIIFQQEGTSRNNAIAGG